MRRLGYTILLSFVMVLVGLARAYGGVIAEADFEGGTVDSSFWRVTQNAAITTDRPHSGQYALKITYPKGRNETDGYLRTPWGALTPYDELFFRYYDYLESDFDFPVGLKTFRFVSGDVAGPFISGQIQWQGGTYDLLDVGGFPRPAGTKLRLKLPPTGGKVQRGVWLCYEVQIKLNDLPEVANGEFRFWVDDVLFGEATGLVIRSSKNPRTFFKGGWVGGNYSDALTSSPNATDGPLVDSIRYIDDVVLSTHRVGCLPDAADKTPPNPPTGLRINSQ